MRIVQFLLLSVSLAACATDVDKDGFKDDEDCNDNDADIFPDANEICDNVDNDCDGNIDEGLRVTWWADADGDTWGDEAAPLETCAQPEGYVDNYRDCDDTSSLFHPGAQETDCEDPADYNCDGSTGYADLDGDGFAACQECDDQDNLVYNGADELCDGLDNDCDLDVDEDPVDAPAWYMDYDGDGFGSTNFTVYECENPDSSVFVDNIDDCDDYHAAAFPGGTESCDGLDNDCDGLFDAADDSVTDADLYYLDADGDGFGAEDSLTQACEGIDGYIEIGEDCDDSANTTNPDALELCNNSIDDDCDATAWCELPMDLAAQAFIGASADDKAGKSLAGIGDINGDGWQDIAIGADYADVDNNGDTEGAAYVFLGPINSLSGATMVSDADLVISGSDALDQAGLVVKSLGDINNDSYTDLAVSASQHSGHPTISGRSKNGAVYVFLGGAGVDAIPSVEVTDADIWIYGDRGFDWFGGSIEAIGDMNGDGRDDFIVGASGDDDGGSQSGAFNLFYSSASWTSGSQVASTSSHAILYGELSNDRVGLDVSGPGDLDGDGVVDVVFGAQYATGSASNSGSVYIGLGPVAAGSASLATLDVKLNGSSASDWAGASLSAAGDTNADGYADLWVSAVADNTPGGSSTGSVFLIQGSADMVTALNGQGMDDVFAARIMGDAANDSIGGSIDGGGDFDGDGNNDLILGATSAGDQGEGLAYLIYGPVTGTGNAGSLAAANFRGEDIDDGAGNVLSFLGDLTGSGQDAIGVAAQYANRGGSDAGAAYIVFEANPN